MRQIRETIACLTEEELDKKIEAYQRSYPYQGYDTRLERKEQMLPDRWVATFSRYNSCD